MDRSPGETQETGASADFTLYGDMLGPSGSEAGTYLGMEAENARTIALGVTGGHAHCRVGGF